MDRRNYDDFNREHFNDDRSNRMQYGGNNDGYASGQPDPRYRGEQQPYPSNGGAYPPPTPNYYQPQTPPAFVSPAVPVYPAPAYYQTVYPAQPVTQPIGVMPYGEEEGYVQDGNIGEEKRKKGGIFSVFRRKDDEMITGSDGSNIIITYPRSHHDVRIIIDNLRRRQAIIVDLSRMPDKNAQRILDFLSGAIYALCGSQQRIGPNMFLLTPGGMSIQVPMDIKKKYD